MCNTGSNSTFQSQFLHLQNTVVFSWGRFWFLYLFFFLTQGLHMTIWLPLNSTCRPGCPWTHGDLPVSGSAGIKGAHLPTWSFVTFRVLDCVVLHLSIHPSICRSVWEGRRQRTTSEGCFFLPIGSQESYLGFQSWQQVPHYPWLSHWPLGFWILTESKFRLFWTISQLGPFEILCLGIVYL